MVRLHLKHFAYLLVLAVTLLFFCEFLIYYIMLWPCHYPLLASPEANQESLHVMVLADPHLLGKKMGHWFDKLRREWQMHRSFQTARTYFRPELVVILGDIFDEGKWASDTEFDQTINRFRQLFYVDEDETEVFIVPGNHDIGFHFATSPKLNNRFEDAFDIPAVKRFSMKGVQFVGVNSMAMENDGCFLCQEGQNQLKVVEQELTCIQNPNDCELEFDFGTKYSAPILLQHYPLYRKSDSFCSGPDAAPEEERNKPFRPNYHCLSNSSTEMLLNKLHPRLVLSGHTHHGCWMNHRRSKKKIPEISVPSFSWRNRNNPSFLLLRVTPEEFSVQKCFMPVESMVIRCYLIGSIIILFLLWRRRR